MKNRTAFALLFIVNTAHGQIFSVCDNPKMSAIECYIASSQVALQRCLTIEQMAIIEFGYEQAYQETNGEKVNGCISKFNRDMVKPYQAALKQVTKNKLAAEQLKKLHEYWQATMASIRPLPSETLAVHLERLQNSRQKLLDDGEQLSSAALQATQVSPKTKSKAVKKK